MIIDSDLIAYDFMTDFNGPERHYPNEFYPSGVYDGEKREYKYGPPSIDYPTLTLPCTLSDENGNTLEDGFYTAALSQDRKYINLYKGNTLKARIKVVKLIEKMYTDSEMREEDEIISRMEAAKAKKKLKKYREAEEELSAYRDRVAANTYAEIQDSGKGYYIIKYNRKNMNATGVIQK